MTMVETSPYLLGHEDREIRRLVDQAALFEREVRWLFDEIAPQACRRAVDLGCGPVGVLGELSRRVGPGGQVAGVDNDPVMLAHARRFCAARGLSNVGLVRADAAATGLPGASFDLAHVRLVLVNVADPAAVVAEAARLVRPGGTVALQEVDWLSWQCEPPHPAWDTLRSLLLALWNSRGFDPCLGRRLPRLLGDAGLERVEAMAHAGIDSAEVPYQRLIVDFAERFADRLGELGLAGRAQLAGLIAPLRAHLGQPGTVVVRAMTVQAWATVPAA